MMASQSSPEAPQSHQNGLQHPDIQASGVSSKPEWKSHLPVLIGSTDEPPAQTPVIDAVPEPTPGNVDTKAAQVDKDAHLEPVQHHQGGKNKEEASDGMDPMQELKARVNAMEQRLLKAGLLKNPEESQTDNGSSSSRQESRDKPDIDQRKPLRKEKSDPEELVQTLMNKVDSLEKRLQENGHLKDEPAADKRRLPAIPQLHYVEWSEFKNKLAEENKEYAIEVLIGGAKYYHQRSEEERKSKQRLKDRSNERSQLVADYKSSVSLPERIRINSRPITLIMNQIDPTDRSEGPTVILRPFKPLVYHEAHIREIFQRLITKWESADTKATSKETIEPNPSKGAGDTGTPALSDGPVNSITAESEEKIKATTAPNDSTASENVNASSNLMPGTIAENSSPALPQLESEDEREETEDLTDSLEALRDLRCLIEFIDVELKPITDSYRDLTRRKVPFCDLWHLFKPGDLAYTPLGKNQGFDFIYQDGKTYPQKPNDRYQELWRVTSTSAGRPHLEESVENFVPIGDKARANAFVVIAYWVEFNAIRFANRSFVFLILPFEGERDITSLHIYPLKYAPKADELKAKCKARGEAFCEFTTFKYRYYTGKTLTCSPSGFHSSAQGYPKHAENVDSQVVVDFSEALFAHPGWRTAGSIIVPDSSYAPGELSEDYPTSYWKDSDRKVLDGEIDDEIYEDEHIDAKMFEKFAKSDSLLKEEEQTNPTGDLVLEEDHLILLPNRVFAFLMKNRKWAMLTMDGLRSVKRSQRGFRDLQLPMTHKRTISYLVNNHFNNRNADLDDIEASYDADLVRGKGKGLIILLHGAPGVGKTSTAETAADAFGKILLPITCGDLGLTAADVERELSEKFHLAELWDCVLLLDEADVFLARRTNNDIKRNSLVSVFLRVLEHFTGVLFLTTNRVGAFDEAFKSRIHISLYYPPLDAEKTWSIWKMNLERLIRKKQRRNESIQIDEEEIFAYAQDHYAETLPRGANWNGRQIRNAFQTAGALAEFEAHELNKKARARCKETGVGFVAKSPQLEVRHFKEIAWASYEFDKYMFETKGVTEAEIASMEGQRRDAYKPTTRLVRAREQQPTQAREAPAPNLVPNRGTRPTIQGQAIPAGRPSESRDRQVNFRPPGVSTYDAMDVQGSQYDQPGAKSAMSYGSRTIAAIPRGERLSIASPRPKTVQQPSAFAAYDRQRQEQAASDLPEPQYVYENQEEMEYGQTYEESLSQATRPQAAHLDDAAQRGISQRLYQADSFPVRSRSQAYVGDSGDEEEFLGM